MAGFDGVLNRLTIVSGSHFLSTLSELSLARSFLPNVRLLRFDAPYTMSSGSGGTAKNADLGICTSNDGREVLVEVFAPFSPTPIENTASGHLDTSTDTSKGTLAEQLERKLKQKAPKASQTSCIGGRPFVLAVDALYHDRAFASLVLPAGNLLEKLNGAVRNLGLPVDEIWIFTHDDRTVGHPLGRIHRYQLDGSTFTKEAPS